MKTINLQVNETTRYTSSKKKFRRDTDLLNKIEETKTLFIKDASNIKLHFKKITCKKDKFRHSTRVLNTQYRILMTLTEETAQFLCICTHKRYEQYNKNC
jgi:plasmid maintenance system killer protein